MPAAECKGIKVENLDKYVEIEHYTDVNPEWEYNPEMTRPIEWRTHEVAGQEGKREGHLLNSRERELIASMDRLHLNGQNQSRVNGKFF